MNNKSFISVFNISSSASRCGYQADSSSASRCRYLLAVIVLVASLLASLLASTVTVSAKTNDTTAEEQNANNIAYELTRYEISTYVNKDHSYDVRQTITVNLPDDREELSFVLPSGSFKLVNLKVNGEEAVAEKLGNDTVVTITDTSQLKNGRRQFEIKYKIIEFEDGSDENDLFYYDALLPAWRVPIGKISIKIQFPSDFPWSDINYYAGAFGARNEVSDLVYEADEENKTVKIEGSRIPQNYSVTVKAQLPNGYWQGALDRSWTAYAIPGGILVALLICALLWLIGGRDPRTKKTIINKPIEGIHPSDATYIFENKVKVKDLITLIVYLASKDYLKISEYHPKKYRLLKNEEPKGEEKFIRNVYNVLFDGVYDKRYLESEDICPRMREVMKNFTLSIQDGFSDDSMSAFTMRSKVCRFLSIIISSIAFAVIPIVTALYQYLEIPIVEPIVILLLTMGFLVLICARYDTKYDSDRQRYAVIMTILSVMLAFIVNFELYKFFKATGLWYIWLGAAILSAGLVFFCIYMGARGKGNAELTNKLLGLRKWIDNAGPQHVAPLQAEDPNYYFSLVPYALVFQSLETWAKAFRGIHIDPPDWYVDDIEGHAEANLRGRMTTLDYAKDIKIFARTIEDEYDMMIKRYHRSKEN